MTLPDFMCCPNCMCNSSMNMILRCNECNLIHCLTCELIENVPSGGYIKNGTAVKKCPSCNSSYENHSEQIGWVFNKGL
jgi:rubrerythrin